MTSIQHCLEFPSARPTRALLVALLLLIYPYVKMQVGLAAALVVLGLVIQRLWMPARQAGTS